jgi:hypothetical protein
MAPIPPRGVLHDNSGSPGERVLADGATGQERQPSPGAGSLTSPRNSINITMASALWYRGFCSSIDRSAQGGGGESDAVASELRLGWRAVGLVVPEEIGQSSLQWDPNKRCDVSGFPERACGPRRMAHHRRHLRRRRHRRRTRSAGRS